MLTPVGLTVAKASGPYHLINRQGFKSRTVKSLKSDPRAQLKKKRNLNDVHWQADHGQLIVIFGSSILSSIKKENVGIPLTKLSGLRMCITTQYDSL